MAPKGTKVKEMTTSNRRAAFFSLLVLCNEGLIRHDDFVRVGASLKLAPRRLKRIWLHKLSNMQAHLNTNHHAPQCILHLILTHVVDATDMPDCVFAFGKLGKAGAKPKYDRQELMEATHLILHNQQSTYRTYTAKLGAPLALDGSTTH